MGNCRFLYNNLIAAASMISPSSLRAGFVTNARKEGTGSAVIVVSGNFSGTEDLEYTVECDSVAGGAEVGQATIRWSDGGGVWDATGVLTAAIATLLNKGVYIAFNTGSGDDFVVGDKWWFKAENLFNSAKLIDWDRDTRLRTAELESPNTFTIDLGSAQQVKVLALYDHNFTNAATITLKGNTTDSGWGSPAFSEAVSYNADKIIHYLSAAQTYRYWRIEIDDAANTDDYLEFSELFLGPYLELTDNFSHGWKHEKPPILASGKNQYGVETDRFFNFQNIWEYPFHLISDADWTSLKTMYEALGDRATGIFQPVFFNKDSASPNDTWMVKIPYLGRTGPSSGRQNFPLRLVEVLRSV